MSSGGGHFPRIRCVDDCDVGIIGDATDVLIVVHVNMRKRTNMVMRGVTVRRLHEVEVVGEQRESETN